MELLRVRDSVTIAAALSRPALVLHISAHSSSRPEEVGFYGHDDSELRLDQLAEELAWLGQGGVVSACLPADGCGTARVAFVRAIRNCLSGECVYISTRRETCWHESTLFSSLFYSFVLRNKGKGELRSARVLRAAEAARKSYSAHLGKQCPYEVQRLTPSRRSTEFLGLTTVPECTRGVVALPCIPPEAKELWVKWSRRNEDQCQVPSRASSVSRTRHRRIAGWPSVRSPSSVRRRGHARLAEDRVPPPTQREALGQPVLNGLALVPATAGRQANDNRKP